jgi:hypothetical protein
VVNSGVLERQQHSATTAQTMKLFNNDNNIEQFHGLPLAATRVVHSNLLIQTVLDTQFQPSGVERQQHSATIAQTVNHHLICHRWQHFQYIDSVLLHTV